MFGSARRSFFRILFIFLSLVMAPLRVFAQGEDPSVPSSGETTETASYWDRHFSLHGFLTLGYADLGVQTKGVRSADEVVLGLEEDGSFPYGNGALNLRFDPSENHSFILQVAVSDLGDSPVDDVGEDVELDWLFYQWQINPTTRLRVGR
ncbi:MAG: hypothetical protein KDD47_09990, partial [Acidobacteria bacterium]|nr:hypothetical protein [Acidobacteriota bacterium]